MSEPETAAGLREELRIYRTGSAWDAAMDEFEAVIRAEARAAALDEARAAVKNVRRSRLVGPVADRHLESGREGHLLDLTEALAAIDALRETER